MKKEELIFSVKEEKLFGMERRDSGTNNRDFCPFLPGLKGSLSNDNGDGNENVISKYKFALL